MNPKPFLVIAVAAKRDCGQARSWNISGFATARWNDRRGTQLLLTIAVLSTVFGGATAQEKTSTAAPAAPNFQAAIAPFFKQHCLRCHGADKKPKGDFRLDELKGEFLPKGGETEIWASILDRLRSREMPPKGEPAPDATQMDRVIDWVRTELARVGKDDSSEMAYPGKANYLDHKLLFDAPSKAAPATPSRIWRMSPFQYDELMVRLVPAEQYKKMPTPIGLTSDHGFRDYAFRYTVGSAETQQMMLNARGILGRVVRLDPRKNLLANVAKLKQPANDAQMQAAVVWLFEEIVRRPPRDDERERYTGLLAKSIERFDNEQGIIQGLAPIFVHPEVVFRSESGAGPSDEHDRILLAPRELAFAFALALTDRPPDAQLMKAALDGELAKRDVARREVERMLNDPAVAKPRILRFFQEYFGYARASDVFKDKFLVHVFADTPHRNLVIDTDQLILHILEKDKDVLRELLTTDQSFVQFSSIQPFLKELAKNPEKAKDYRARMVTLERYYNLTIDQWQPVQPLTLPASQRAGILTQPSWLVAHSNNVDNQPIHRGRWIYEHLLGGTIPDTPITVDATLPDEPHNTLRERMRFTREAYCWTCHQRMNPIGQTFEMFTGHGQFRTEEALTIAKTEGKIKKNVAVGVPADATGELRDSGDPALDRPVDGALELVHRLAKSERVHQVFVRHAFRYWMGRNETLDDAPTLQAAYRAYKDNNGSMKALIASLLTSDSFVYRRLAAEQENATKK